jgi:hypothetical protein
MDLTPRYPIPRTILLPFAFEPRRTGGNLVKDSVVVIATGYITSTAL